MQDIYLFGLSGLSLLMTLTRVVRYIFWQSILFFKEILPFLFKMERKVSWICTIAMFMIWGGKKKGSVVVPVVTVTIPLNC